MPTQDNCAERTFIHFRREGVRCDEKNAYI